MGVLAIDPGERKTGFAVTDAMRIAFEPLPAFRVQRPDAAKEELLDHVAALLDERTISVVLVGLPLHMSGEESERARTVRAWTEQLSTRFPGLEVVTYDERLTTKEAESRLREAGYRGRQIAQRKDSWSALVLLEDWVRSGEPR